MPAVHAKRRPGVTIESQASLAHFRCRSRFISAIMRDALMGYRRVLIRWMCKSRGEGGMFLSAYSP